MVKADEIEVLAPCGRPCDIMPVIDAGADAIYVGLSGYSARPKSSDFTAEEICESLPKIKAQNKKLYVAVNANVENEYISDLCEKAKTLDKAGVDAFIVSDYGLIDLMCKTVKNASVHSSTISGTYNYEDVKLLKSMGVKRVILSTDLFVDEISDIIDNAGDMEYEMVANGGICFNSNRQCLLPHVGSNEGYTVFCQKEYDLIKDGQVLGRAKRIGSVACHMHRDMGLYVGMGISSFKIEGRTNNIDYVLKRVKSVAESKRFVVEHADEIAGMMHYVRRQG
ncbi:MAG: U32 family peptidase [Clostridiales bacterium]|nr:U32 family peptidase [Clostridiales bacterium]